MNTGIDYQALKDNLYDFIARFAANTVSPYIKGNISINTLADSTDYTIILNGNTYTHNSGVGATKHSIIIGLIAAIEIGGEPVSVINLGDNFDIEYDGNTNGFTIIITPNMTFLPLAITFWANQSAPSPADPKFSLNIISGINSIGKNDKSYDNDESEFVSEGLRTFTLSVQSYGDTAMGDMSRLKDRLFLNSSNEYLSSLGMSISNNPSITSIPELLDTTYEERAVMDIMFYLVSRQADGTDSIGTVDVSYQLSDLSGSFEVEL